MGTAPGCSLTVPGMYGNKTFDPMYVYKDTHMIATVNPMHMYRFMFTFMTVAYMLRLVPSKVRCKQDRGPGMDTRSSAWPLPWVGLVRYYPRHLAQGGWYLDST